MLEYLGFFAASYFYVGLLGLQQKVVATSNMSLLFPVSLLITTANYYVVTNASDNSYLWFMTTAGLGGACGIYTSIYMHDKIASWFKNRKADEKTSLDRA